MFGVALLSRPAMVLSDGIGRARPQLLHGG